MHDLIIYNAKIFNKGNFIEDGGVAIDAGKISTLDTSESIKSLEAKEKIDLGGDYLTPGYIDLHTHGLLDWLVDNGKEDLESISANFPKFGTTSFLPTIIPHPPAEEEDFLKNITRADVPGAEYLGFFLEGPFIALTGAIDPEALKDQSPNRARRISDALSPYRTVFAVSPEIKGLPDIINEMDKPIFMTHTAANVTETLDAIKNGCSHATHFFDVFPAPKEQDPGVRPCGTVEAILQAPEVSVDFILDGEHVDPIAVKLALACKPVEKVCLITDSNLGAGMEPGVYEGIGGDEVIFKYPGSPARGTENSRFPGSLYGSGLTMDTAVRNVIKYKVGTLEQAITMASTSPAKVLNVYGKKGDIDSNFDADLLRLSPSLEVLTTWVGGKKVFSKN